MTQYHFSFGIPKNLKIHFPQSYNLQKHNNDLLN